MNVKFFIFLCFTALVAGTASASLIDEGIFNLPSKLGNPAAEETWLETQFGPGLDLTYLQKFDVGSGLAESPGIGTFTFAETGASPDTASTADVTWDLSATAYDLAYVLVVDGNDGGVFPYHIYSVDSLQLKNSITPQGITVNNAKNISHASFFGTPSGGFPPGSGGVPEPASVVAWSLLTLMGAGVVYRRRYR